MAKTITRQTLKLFGKDGASSNFGEFGSAAAGTPVTTKTIATIQSLAAWLAGWQNAVAAGQAPYLQDMNALMYVLCYEMCYQLQDGIAEWDSGTSYYIGSLVRRAGTSEIYSSKTDDNLNNAFPTAGTSDTNWQFVSGVISSVFRVGGPLAMNSQQITGLADASAITGAATLGQFKVRQVGTPVWDTTTTNVTSATWTDTATTATITPTQSSSRILVIAIQSCYAATNIGGTVLDLRLVRGASTVVRTFPNVLVGPTPGLTGNVGAQLTFMDIDSPATGSAVTYKTQIQNQNSLSTAATNRGSGTPTSGMLLVEVV